MGLHAVITQTACMVGGGDKARAQCIHTGQRRDLAGVAEIIRIFTAGQRRTGRRFGCEDTRVSKPAQLICHEGSNQPAEIGAAAGTADDDIGVFTELLHRSLGLQPDNGLVQKNLIEHRAQHIALAAAAFYSGLHSL